ncbi:beta-glucosidase BglX [Endozoicomonas elysicola]|uniref:Periplasmic beta-glucosidase n=1 Tax=Endozoicomonas elysicola TaxID=305900 RepID=A0A081KBI7_9GAMM|nr:beta-glucosidase BglX [Endozoicomonas elysicola]KEI71513.1 beta-glucosidase [Endozoicomonas elysicola]
MKCKIAAVIMSCITSLPTIASEAGYLLNPDKALVPASKQHWQDDQKVMDTFISDLISRMTLAEKIGQLDLQSGFRNTTGPYVNDAYEQQIREGRVGAVFNAYGADFTRELQKIAVEETRLGIPLIIGHDIIHGHKTIFPQSLGEAASWDPEVARMGARVAAIEATADGIAWTFAPMADITRDPRWGRVSEGAGEDVYLGTMMAVARVQGFQGEDLSQPDTMMATAKHFAGYGLSQAGRDYHSTDVSELELWTTQLPPFKAMVDAGVATVMTAFNDLNGIPATGSRRLLTDILREQWGFEGFVVTDYTAINELVPHGFARDEKHAAEIAFNAGVDMDMVGMTFIGHMEALVAEGKVSESQINESVRRILEMKWRLGLFEDPYRYSDPARAEREILSEQHLDMARDAARRSMVLLKNDHQTLPLNADSLNSIALIGPLAHSRRDMIGNWAGAGDRSEQPVSVLEGMVRKLEGQVAIHYAPGATYAYLHDADSEEAHIRGKGVSRMERDDPRLVSLFQEALAVAEKSDVIVMVMGEEERMSGEASSRVDLMLPGNQRQLMKALKKLGKPMVLVLMSGRPNVLDWEDEHVDAILHAWYPGTSGGHAIADVLMGEYNPSGKLPMTFPRSVGQVPIYYNARNTGRPYDAGSENPRSQHYTSRYDDSPNTPLYAFGHGLSYTDFEYGKVQLSSHQLKTRNDELTVSVDITNTGEYSGEEVVQLYTRQLVGSTTRPVKELKGFRKIQFAPGERKRVSFSLRSDDLAFYRADMSWGAEPGDFHVFVGSSSDRVQQAEFTLVDK